MLISKLNTVSELTLRIKEGDQHAFKEFYQLFHSHIYKFLVRYTADPQASKDLMQDTFIKFWNKRTDLDAGRAPKTYLFSIARNLALNYLSRNPISIELENKDEVLVRLAENPLHHFENKFLISDLQKAVILLPERCRVIFILSRYNDFSYQEIAEMLELSVQTVKNQMSKSLSLLRKNLSHYLD